MISKRLARSAAAIAVAAGMTVATTMSAAVAAPVSAHSASAKSRQLCSGYLNDGAGSGSANSLTPATTPFPGEVFTQQYDSDAWKMTQSSCVATNFQIIVASTSPPMCEASNNNIAVLRGCDPAHSDQLWSKVDAHGGFLLENENGGYLCATGGIGTGDSVVGLSSCKNSYRDTWNFVG